MAHHGSRDRTEESEAEVIALLEDTRGVAEDILSAQPRIKANILVGSKNARARIGDKEGLELCAPESSRPSIAFTIPARRTRCA